jgi:hypothetical protein
METCAQCSGTVPERARFCPHCGAAQNHETAPQEVQVEAEVNAEWSWCEVEWVQSFRGSVFEARPLSPGADSVARSARFPWRGGGPPPETNAEARVAHEDLVHTLVAGGWEPVGETGPWYAERFRRATEPSTHGVSTDRSDERSGVQAWARPAIAALTVVSLAVIGFALLVFLGFFR